jgi:hypothetical protein
MKATLTVKSLLLAVSFLAAALLAGCTTVPPVDWNSRVGNYTYDQAVAEYGSPTTQSQSNDGKVVAKWVTQQNTGASLNTGMAYYGSTGFAGNQNAGPGHRARTLQLTFGANGKLLEWSKNY